MQTGHPGPKAVGVWDAHSGQGGFPVEILAIAVFRSPHSAFGSGHSASGWTIRIAVYAPGGYIGGREAYELGVDAGYYLVATFGKGLGASPDLEASRLAIFGEVVHDEGDAAGCGGIMVLLARAHASAHEIYCVEIRVIDVAKGNDVQFAVTPQRGHAAYAVALQVLDFGPSKYAHSFSFTPI
jgi:hypothetical protein